MVFAGMFMGNNKNDAAPAPPPAPSTYSVYFEPFEVGPDAFEASINIFGVDSGPVPLREAVLVTDGIEEGASSPATGTGFAILGDPGLFEVIGAEFSELEFFGDSWSCFIFNVTGDVTVRLPVGAM